MKFTGLRRLGGDAAGLLIALLLIPACMPKDPQQTLEQVRQRELRVGVSEAAPWTRLTDPPAGVEVTLVEQFAEELGTAIRWEPGSEDTLMRKLEHWELDLVICGLRHDTPWKTTVALTRPYLVIDGEKGKEKHVWALPPGENAWILRVERFLKAKKQTALQLWEEER